jgi:hypothetical protein
LQGSENAGRSQEASHRPTAPSAENKPEITRETAAFSAVQVHPLLSILTAGILSRLKVFPFSFGAKDVILCASWLFSFQVPVSVRIDKILQVMHLETVTWKHTPVSSY